MTQDTETRWRNVIATSWLSSVSGTLIASLILTVIGSGIGLYVGFANNNQKIRELANSQLSLDRRIDQLERRDNYLERSVGKLVVQCLSRKEQAALVIRDPKHGA